MTPSKPKPPQNLANPPANNAWQEEQRRVRDRNDEARRAGKKERADRERRHDVSQRARDQRGGIER